MTTVATLPARVAAARMIAGVIAHGQSLAALAPSLLERVALDERALAQELVYGALRQAPRLLRCVDALLRRPLRARDADIQGLLLIGAYQLAAMRIPAHAAVDTTVEACRTMGKPWAAGLVNAVLRGFVREQGALEQRFGADPEFAYAHPEWLLAALRQAWPAHWQAVVAANNTRPPMSLRVNLRRGTRAAYRELLRSAHCQSHDATCTDAGIVLETAVSVDRLPGFAAGLVSVQDAAAQLAAPLLDMAPGMRVLDACAAPGGKTGHLLELEPSPGSVLAIDVDPDRCAHIGENLTRLGVTATVAIADAAAPATWWDGTPFDRILLDAPCTATGVIRRHPDIKLLRRAADLAAMTAGQARLLDALWPLLAPEGKLLYVTCSVLPAENQDQIRAFLARHSDARLDDLDLPCGRQTGAGFQILPGENDMDGFFFCRVVRRARA
ncbi:MAG: 16S rRNA (cytosine(967)-C(5))-methyltransferase RsmB [Gammaproteobacteria bacterium]|nr:16S rRNA (cytosine(967)-C(5))-methyltransferase RsmB [Gammaproteobacteria bacterium]